MLVHYSGAKWSSRESNPITRYATPVLYHLSYNPVESGSSYNEFMGAKPEKLPT